MNTPVTHAECSIQTEKQTQTLKEHFTEAIKPIKEEIARLVTGQTYIKHRLFEDNGAACFQTRLSKLEFVLNRLMYVVIAMGLSIFAAALTFIVAILKHMIINGGVA